MSCTNCTRKSGCEEHKGEQRVAIADTLRALYPDYTWGRLDDEARFRAGVRLREARSLGRAISVAARAPTFFREGGPDDLCHYVYVLCFGREPALVDVRDGVVEAAEVDAGAEVRERYLRVHFSTLARLATIQEVAMELDRDGDDRVLRELPRPGVYDPTLLKRMRAIVDLIEASDIEHLDFGLVDKPHPEARPGDYVQRYGVEPALVNFLFYPQPARTSSVTLL